MTRREAIEKWICPAITIMWNNKTCNEILKALEQEPCEDAISRQAVLDIVNNPLNIRLVENIKKLLPITLQEPILDKIRAEIEDLDKYFDNDYFSGNNEPLFKCNEVFQIIDKYKAESGD